MSRRVSWFDSALAVTHLLNIGDRKEGKTCILRSALALMTLKTNIPLGNATYSARTSAETLYKSVILLWIARSLLSRCLCLFMS